MIQGPSNGKPLVLTVCLLGMGLAAWAPAAADEPLFSPVSQDRFVDVQASGQGTLDGGSDSDHDAAADFGPFDSEVGASVFFTGIENVRVQSWASQSSAIETDAIRATGIAGYSIDMFGVNPSATASASSEVNIVFSLTDEAEYTIEGTLNAYHGGSGLWLTQTEHVLHESYAFWDVLELNEAGTLPAGEYTIRTGSWVADGAWGAIQLDGEPGYDVTFRVNPVGFAGPGGEVPDGDDVSGGPPLRVDRLVGDYVRLFWGPSCRFGDTDYAVYQGELGVPFSLFRKTCSTGGELEYEFEAAADAAYFIVVPRDGISEGSYGDDSAGVERTPPISACRPQLLGDPVCP